MARTLPIRLRTIAAAIVVIASGLMIWNAYQSIIGSSDLTTATVPVIKADDEPFRRAPENPGGAVIPNQGSTLFNVLNAENTDDMALDGVNIAVADKVEPVSILDEMPPETSGFELPEIPQKRTESLYNVLDELEEETQDVAEVEPIAEDVKDDLKEKLQKAIEKAEAKTQQDIVKKETNPEIISEPQPKDVLKVVQDDSVDGAVITIKPARKPPVPDIKKAQAKPDTPKPTLNIRDVLNPKTNMEDRFYIQLASLKGEDAAKAAYAKIRSNFPNLVEAVSVSYPKADLGARGTFTRIQIGPMTEPEARNRCAQYTSSPNGGTCLVIKR